MKSLYRQPASSKPSGRNGAQYTALTIPFSTPDDDQIGRGRDRTPIPVATFARLHNALAEGDFALAKRLVRKMREYGYSVVMLAPRERGGPAR